MWKNFMRKLRKDEPPPLIRIDQQKRVLLVGNTEVLPYSEDCADTEILNSITSIRVVLDHCRDTEPDFYRLSKLYQLLCQEYFSLPDLKHLFYNSLGYQYYTIRSLVWKTLLEYLPDRKNKWIAIMESKKRNYEKMLVDNLCATVRRKVMAQKTYKQEEKEPTQITTEITVNVKKDHPLNRNSDSAWNSYFKDVELWNRIERDTSRTRQNVPFFQSYHEYDFEHEYFNLPLHLSNTNRGCRHQDAISRILFLYAKLHPKYGYCQGMNDIAALLYFCFTNQNTEYERRVSESDAYFCFEIVMSRVGYSNFSSNYMLSARVQHFGECLKKVDPKLAEILRYAKIDLKLISMRWFMVYMLHEFDINNSLIIWDGLLCSYLPMSRYLYYVCLAVLFQKRYQIIETPMTVFDLQKLKLKPEAVLETASNLFKEYPQLAFI